MIKKLDEIPASIPKDTQRGQMRRDLETALANDVYKFELVGECYNKKTLAPTFREVARRYFHDMYVARTRELARYEGVKRIIFYNRALVPEKAVRVHGRTIDGEKHVYVELFPEEVEKYAQLTIEKLKEEQHEQRISK